MLNMNEIDLSGHLGLKKRRKNITQSFANETCDKSIHGLTNRKLIYTLIFLSLISVIGCQKTQKKNQEIELEKTTKTNNKEDWIKRVERLNKMKEGDTIVVFDNQASNKKPKKSNNSKYLIDVEQFNAKKESINFEDSSYWRKKAFEASSKYIINGIKKKPNCKIMRQGSYTPLAVKYIGNRTFFVKFYCEFDCKQDYDNASDFYLEAYYQGSNYWDIKLIKQKFLD